MTPPSSALSIAKITLGVFAVSSLVYGITQKDPATAKAAMIASGILITAGLSLEVVTSMKEKKIEPLQPVDYLALYQTFLKNDSKELERFPIPLELKSFVKLAQEALQNQKDETKQALQLSTEQRKAADAHFCALFEQTLNALNTFSPGPPKPFIPLSGSSALDIKWNQLREKIVDLMTVPKPVAATPLTPLTYAQKILDDADDTLRMSPKRALFQ